MQSYICCYGEERFVCVLNRETCILRFYPKVQQITAFAGRTPPLCAASFLAGLGDKEGRGGVRRDAVKAKRLGEGRIGEMGSELTNYLKSCDSLCVMFAHVAQNELKDLPSCTTAPT